MGEFNKQFAYLPNRLCRYGSQLLNLQCWLWGQDTRSPESNLLLAAGLQRLRPPAGRSGCSQYSIPLTPGSTLKLWGFGIYVGGASGVFLGRFDFYPREASGLDGWSPGDLDLGRHTSQLEDLVPALRWMSEYESSTVEAIGPACRRRAAEGGPETSFDPACLADQWKQLMMTVENWRTTKCLHSEMCSGHRHYAQLPERNKLCAVARRSGGSRAFGCTTRPSSSNTSRRPSHSK
jgi:hypothetical protein